MTAGILPENFSEHEAEFFRLCVSHDLTYDESDDFEMYSQGKHQYDFLRAYAKEHLDYASARDIWNYVVDQKLGPLDRAGYYWESFHHAP